MSEVKIEKPNAFVFKAKIEDDYKLCVCPRINDEWSEEDIFYLSEPQKDFYDSIEEKLFHIVFVIYRKDDNGIWIDPGDDPFFIKHDEITSEQLYANQQFFSTIEGVYKKVYENSESEIEIIEKESGGQGGQTETDE